MTFAADIRRFTDKTEKAIDQTVRGITLRLFSGVVQSTPVDTGRLKGNWQVSQGSPATGTLTSVDKSGAVTIAAIAVGMGGWGSVTYLANNLPYAHRIEFDGWSKQSPAGMVRINMARIRQHVAAEARKHKV